MPEFEIKTLADLTGDTDNPNRGTDRGREMVRKSIEKLKFGRSVVADFRGRLIAGNKTVEQAKAAGFEEIIVVPTDGRKLVVVQRTDLDLETDPLARELSIADNATAAAGLDWDPEILAAIEEAGQIDLKQFFTDDQLAEILAAAQPPPAETGEDQGARIDEAEELGRKWGTERGQLWLIPSRSMPGRFHRLLCGDSTDAADVRRLMNEERAILFATDPPYLVNYTGDDHPQAWGKKDGNKDWSGTYGKTWDDADQPDLYPGFIRTAIEEAILPNAAWYCWHASRRQAYLESVWEQFGAFVHQQIIWVKNAPVLTYSRYLWQHEPCLFGWLKGNEPPKVDEQFLTTVWEMNRVEEAIEHPTVKPLDAFGIPMRQHARIGELCYEPFSGSGTQLVAGETNGRRVYAMEISPAYVGVALERLAGMGLEPRLEA